MLGHVHKFLRVLRTLFAFEIITQPLPAAWSLGYWTNRLVGAGSWLIPPPSRWFLVPPPARSVRPWPDPTVRTFPSRPWTSRPISSKLSSQNQCYSPLPLSLIHHPPTGGWWVGGREKPPPPTPSANTHPPTGQQSSLNHLSSFPPKIHQDFWRISKGVCACVCMCVWVSEWGVKV